MGGSTSPACRELLGGIEGWVQPAFMVDPAGKPFEVTVTRSHGDRTFEKAATRAIERSTFEPGSLNGKAVESGYELKYLFVSDKAESYPGASHDFAKADKALMRAIAANDRAAADAALKGLKITNLYEDAYFGLATYSYAAKWGDATQQLAGLRRAIAEENLARYLPQDAFRSALLACMELELNAHEYAEAFDAVETPARLGIRQRPRKRGIGPIFEQLRRTSRGWFSHTRCPEHAGGRIGTCICPSGTLRPGSIDGRTRRRWSCAAKEGMLLRVRSQKAPVQDFRPVRRV